MPNSGQAKEQMKGDRRRKQKPNILSLVLPWLSIALVGELVGGVKSSAQIAGDGTLPENTTVDRLGEEWRVTGGTTKGTNLFHSFGQFSLPANHRVYFNNSPAIDNIITRVTGGEMSRIDGIIEAKGTANLFLINPNGISFGPNAGLNIGGSFATSTARKIVFADGFTYGTEDGSDTPPLLTVNVPLGLELGPNPQPIAIRGGTLQVNPGRTLTLLGGNINLEAGKLAGGNGISIASLSVPGRVNFDASFRLSDLPATGRGNIGLTDKSSIRVTESGSHITIATGNLVVDGGSRIESLLSVPGRGGQIRIDATDSVTISSFSEDGSFSGILSLTGPENAGTGGNITMDNPQADLTLRERGFIATVTRGDGNTGDLAINVGNLELLAGGEILSLSTGRGNPGQIAIQAAGNIRIAGKNFQFQPSPFADLNLFALDSLPENNRFDPDVEASGATGIPYISLSRTPTQIFGGTALLSEAEDRVFDFYSFTVTEANSRAIFDLDFGATGLFNDRGPGSIVAELFLFDFNTGTVLASNDGSFDITLGGGGSTSNLDPYIDTILREPGRYVLAVGESESDALNSASLPPLIGNPIDRGDTYTLHVSLENRGSSVDAPIVPHVNPNGFNPNFGPSSGIFSISAIAGNGATVTIDAGQLSILDGGEISAATLGSGRGADIDLSVTGAMEIRDNTALLTSIARGSGSAGNLKIQARTLTLANRGRIDASTFGTGNGGRIDIRAGDGVVLDSLGGEISATGIFSEVRETAVGNSGDINLDTGFLLVNGAKISGSTRGTGNGSNLNVTATERVVFDNRSDIDFEVDDDAIGNGGNINIAAPTIQLANRSELEAEVDGRGRVGSVNLTASEMLLLENSEIQVEIDVEGEGTGGDINLSAPVILLLDGTVVNAQVDARAKGNGGRIDIRAAERVVIDGSELETEINPGAVGSGGEIAISTGELEIVNGASLSASTGGEGNGGAIILTVAEAIAVDGSRVSAAVETGARGNGGQITLRGKNISASNGAQIQSSTATDFDAGSIMVEATAELQLSGADTGLFAATESGSTANGGSIIIRAPETVLANGAAIGVNSQGSGLGGSIRVEGDNLALADSSDLSAETASNRGGEITLDLDGLLWLRRNSNLSATAGNGVGGGDGGNITISVPFILALPGEDSNITANAFAGAGGNIQIGTNRIFGLTFRDRETPGSDITASSEFGVGGNVEINSPEAEPTSGLVELSANTVDSSEKITVGCGVGGNSFTVTGRGGLPEDPTDTIRSSTVWQDWQDLALEGRSVPSSIPEPDSLLPRSLRATGGWIVNREGNVELVAGSFAPHLQCGDVSQSRDDR